MTNPEKSEEDWSKKKEELKQKFLLLTDKYSMFEGGEQKEVSEKLRLRLFKTKEELLRIIGEL